MVVRPGNRGIGLANAKMLCREFKYDFDKMRHAGEEELVAVMVSAVFWPRPGWTTCFRRNNQMVDRLLAELNIERNSRR